MRSVLRNRWRIGYRDFSFSIFTVVETPPATKLSTTHLWCVHNSTPIPDPRMHLRQPSERAAVTPKLQPNADAADDPAGQQ